jgi:hypothetical protein
VLGSRAREARCPLQLHHLHNPMIAVAPLDNCITCALRVASATRLSGAAARPAYPPPPGGRAGRAGRSARRIPPLPQQLPTPHTQSPHTTSFNPNPSPPMWGPSPSPVRLPPISFAAID